MYNSELGFLEMRDGLKDNDDFEAYAEVCEDVSDKILVE